MELDKQTKLSDITWTEREARLAAAAGELARQATAEAIDKQAEAIIKLAAYVETIATAIKAGDERVARRAMDMASAWWRKRFFTIAIVSLVGGGIFGLCLTLVLTSL